MTNELKHWRGPIPTPSDRQLADTWAVSQLVKVYALGIDMRDYELTRSVFSDGATASGFVESTVIDEYLPRVFDGAAAFQATQHNITNQHVTVNGDQAIVWSYAIAVHKAPAEGELKNLTVGVQYRDECSKTEAGWLISSRKVVTQWSERN